MPLIIDRLVEAQVHTSGLTIPEKENLRQKIKEALSIAYSASQKKVEVINSTECESCSA